MSQGKDSKKLHCSIEFFIRVLVKLDFSSLFLMLKSFGKLTLEHQYLYILYGGDAIVVLLIDEDVVNTGKIF